MMNAIQMAEAVEQARDNVFWGGFTVIISLYIHHVEVTGNATSSCSAITINPSFGSHSMSTPDAAVHYLCIINLC